MELKEICSKLKNDYHLVYLRGTWTGAGDIDFYQSSAINEVQISQFLEQNSFFIRNKSKFKCSWARYNNRGRFELIDIENNLNKSILGFSRLRISESCINEYLSNPQEDKAGYNIYRHLLSFKKSSQKVKMVKTKISLTHPKQIFVISPFRFDLEERHVEAIMMERIIGLFKALKFQFFCDYLLVKLRRRILKIKNAKTLVLIGIDGAGKSTLIKLLAQIHPSKVIYMGSGDYVIPFLNQWIPRLKAGMFVKLILLYIENWYKQLNILFYRCLGWNVLVDRHPKYQFITNKYGLGYAVNYVFYNFLFLRPNNVIILYADAEIIAARKAEKSIKEIQLYYEKMRRYTGDKKEIWLINDDINGSLKQLNKILVR